jgi:hypothetical protein
MKVEEILAIMKNMAVSCIELEDVEDGELYIFEVICVELTLKIGKKKISFVISKVVKMIVIKSNLISQVNLESRWV